MKEKRGIQYDEEAVQAAADGTLKREAEEAFEQELLRADVTSVGSLALDLGFPAAPEASRSKQHTRMYREIKERDPPHKRTCSVCLRRVPLNQIRNEVCNDCDHR